MTAYLLDTSVASALAPGRGGPLYTKALEWLEANEPSLRLSAVTIMEIESGIQQLARAGSTRKRPELSAWLAGLLQTFADRVLPFDRHVAVAAGRIEASAIAAGRHPGLADIMIAATAEVHGLTILTRNLRHFEPLGIAASDPFTDSPIPTRAR